MIHPAKWDFSTESRALISVDHNKAIYAGADPGFDQGGPQIVTGLNCRRAQQCCVSDASPFQHGVQGRP